MAIVVISSVPVTSGTMPNAPDEPTWSARIAVCGLHCRPNRNSSGETFSKKRTVSNSTENTMPMVVRTATHARREQDDLDEALDLVAGAELGRQGSADQTQGQAVRTPGRPPRMRSFAHDRTRHRCRRHGAGRGSARRNTVPATISLMSRSTALRRSGSLTTEGSKAVSAWCSTIQSATGAPIAKISSNGTRTARATKAP